MARKLSARIPANNSLHVTFRNMVRRCYTPTDKDYPDYGGRGVTICERWLNNPSLFYEDMGAKPTGYSLNRIDNEKGYSPENCEWASPRNQALNTRKNNGHSNVYFNKLKQKWYVQAMIDRKRVWGGYHDTLEDALKRKQDLGL